MTVAIVAESEARRVIPPALFFVLKTALAILKSFVFPHKLLKFLF